MKVTAVLVNWETGMAVVSQRLFLLFFSLLFLSFSLLTVQSLAEVGYSGKNCDLDGKYETSFGNLFLLLIFGSSACFTSNVCVCVFLLVYFYKLNASQSRSFHIYYSYLFLHNLSHNVKIK